MHLNAERQRGYANVESKLRFPHSHSLDDYGLLSELNQQPSRSSMLLKCAKNTGHYQSRQASSRSWEHSRYEPNLHYCEPWRGRRNPCGCQPSRAGNDDDLSSNPAAADVQGRLPFPVHQACASVSFSAREAPDCRMELRRFVPPLSSSF
jgi:hypothetical protein